MSTQRVAIVLRLGGLVLAAALIGWFAYTTEWDQLGRALHRADLLLVLVAALLYFVSLLGKALLWRILLAPHDVPVRRLFRYTIAAFAASVLAPARAGELLRVLALKQRDGIPTGVSTGVAVTDKLLHAVTLLVLAAPLPLLLPDLPGWVGDSLLVGAGIAAGVMLVSYIAAGRVDSRAPDSWVGRFLAGMHAVREPARLLGAIGVLAIVWMIDLVTLVAVLRAVDLDVSLAGSLFILFTVNLAIAIPATPANVGTLQLGALLATGLLGIPHEPALAFALLYHAIQILPTLAVGIALEFRLVIPAGAVR